MLGKGARPVSLGHLCVVARGARGPFLRHGGGDGLICVCLIGAESASASSLGVGGDGNGCGGCGDDGFRLVQRETQLGAMNELVKAFWLVSFVVERLWRVWRNLSSGVIRKDRSAYRFGHLISKIVPTFSIL